MLIFAAFVIFGVAWVVVQSVRDPLPIWQRSVDLHPELRTAFIAVQIAGLTAFIGAAIGCVALIGSAVVRNVRMDRSRALRLTSAPIVVSLLFVLYAIVVLPSSTARQGPASDSPLTFAAIILQLGFVALALAVLTTFTLTAGLVVGRGEPSRRAVRFAIAPAAITALAQIAGAAAMAILILLTIQEAPELQLSPPVGAGVGILLTVATGLAAVGLLRARPRESGAFPNQPVDR
jgi:hypothetical protein